MTTITLTRAQYDYLVTNCQCWMERHWSEYSKQWGIGGVAVTSQDWRIENLRCQLPG